MNQSVTFRKRVYSGMIIGFACICESLTYDSTFVGKETDPHLKFISFDKDFFSDLKLRINTSSMKQPDLYYFEATKMTSQAQSNFAWRIRAAGEYSL